MNTNHLLPNLLLALVATTFLVAGCNSDDDGQPLVYQTIHEAAKNGDLADVKRHANRGAEVDMRDDGSLTPLQVAAQAGYVTVVKYLTSSGADVNVTDTHGETPLHWNSSIARVQPDLTEVLIANGADVNAMDNDGRTPLHYATKYGFNEVKECIRRASTDNTLLQYQLTTDDLRVLRMVQLLVDAGADVNAADGSGRTALHNTAAGGLPNATSYLISIGAVVDARTDAGKTALHDALDFTPYTMIRSNRIRRNRNLQFSSGEKVLQQAPYGERVLQQAPYNVAKLLLASGADPNARTRHRPHAAGRTPLSYAASGSHFEAIDLLLSNGARVHNEFDIALHRHVESGDIDAVKVVLKYGASVDARDEVTGTPVLHRAIQLGYSEITEALLARGADIHAPSNRGQTSLINAARVGDARLAKYMITHGAEINVQCDDGWTPLHAAAARGHLDVVKLLVNYGANTELRDKTGRTALSKAENDSVVQFLKEHMDEARKLEQAQLAKVRKLEQAQKQREFALSNPPNVVVVAVMSSHNGGYAIVGDPRWGGRTADHRTIRLGDTLSHLSIPWRVAEIDVAQRAVTIKHEESGTTHVLASINP